MSPFAAIADIHGNALALEAVLADIRARGIERVVNLGDTADDAMEPGRAVALVMAAGIESIAGNYETRAGLSEAQLAWLDGLPKVLDLGPGLDAFCCHGTPESDVHALIEDISPGRIELAPEAIILERLGGVRHGLVLCAHKHMPRAVWLPSTGQFVVNPGSVGWPAYWNDEPALHKVEAGSPHARYAVLFRDGEAWQTEHVAVPYDWAAAAATAKGPYAEERRQALLTGRVTIPAHALDEASLD